MKTKKILFLIVPPVLLVTSASLILTGILIPRHELYYPALFFLMLSVILETLELSLCWHSRKGFALSLLNLIILVAFELEHLLENFPVIASQDWHLGIVIMLLYVINVGFYAYFFRKQLSGFRIQRIMFIATVGSPLIAAGLFYLGAESWIGLSLWVFLGAISLFAVKSCHMYENKV